MMTCSSRAQPSGPPRVTSRQPIGAGHGDGGGQTHQDDGAVDLDANQQTGHGELEGQGGQDHHPHQGDGQQHERAEGAQSFAIGAGQFGHDAHSSMRPAAGRI